MMNTDPSMIRDQRGSMIPLLIVFIVVIGIISMSVGGAIVATFTSVKTSEQSALALNIAEAGVNYYVWHLNHDGSDLKDGNPSAILGPDGYGPFEHDYRDMTGKVVGKYTLYIKPTLVGSSVVVVRSIGEVDGIRRSVDARLGAMSYAAYAVAGNQALWFGNNETANGPVHSNVGVKMDGPSTGTVSSASTSYLVPSNHGNGRNTIQPGVWCDPTVTSPVNCNTRNKSNWLYPTAKLDFVRLSSDMCDLKKLATSLSGPSACDALPSRTESYVPPISTNYNRNTGYLIELNSNGTYRLSRVTNERDKRPAAQALTTVLIANNIPIPANGVIFVEDNVWLRRSSNAGFDGRVTIVAARLSGSATGNSDANIVFAGSVTYADQYNGDDAIGGIAEGSVEIAPYAGVPLEIHGAYIAKSGDFVYRQRSREDNTYTKGWVNGVEKFRFFGSVSVYGMWTWSYFGYSCSNENSPQCWQGYKWTETAYDENLRYNPPPSFPLTDTFEVLAWREVLVRP
ncbi:hypothetical protein EOL73_03790 [Candidatus Saccharibacteria bacterium]|nr:hypothetical protein [Candidatus Saccharibacteria bacterium]